MTRLDFTYFIESIGFKKHGDKYIFISESGLLYEISTDIVYEDYSIKRYIMVHEKWEHPCIIHYSSMDNIDFIKYTFVERIRNNNLNILLND